MEGPPGSGRHHAARCAFGWCAPAVGAGGGGGGGRRGVGVQGGGAGGVDEVPLQAACAHKPAQRGRRTRGTVALRIASKRAGAAPWWLWHTTTALVSMSTTGRSSICTPRRSAAPHGHMTGIHSWRSTASHGWGVRWRTPHRLRERRLGWRGTRHCTRHRSRTALSTPRGRLRLVQEAIGVAAQAGWVWLHADFEPHLERFYLDVCGFRTTAAGLSRSRAHHRHHPASWPSVSTSSGSGGVARGAPGSG